MAVMLTGPPDETLCAYRRLIIHVHAFEA
jgi:hypothetical protein